MKKTWVQFSALVFAVALLVPASLLAQKEEKDKVKEKKDVRQIIVIAKGDKNEKIVVEVVGDKITVNGKPLEEYKGENGNINVKVNMLKDLESLTIARSPKGSVWNMSGDNNFQMFSDDANHAMLGVTTEKIETGVRIQDITKESGAEKAGLKVGDYITKIQNKEIVCIIYCRYFSSSFRVCGFSAYNPAYGKVCAYLK